MPALHAFALCLGMGHLAWHYNTVFVTRYSPKTIFTWCAERGLTLILQNGDDLTTSGVMVLARALRSALRSAPQVFHAAGRWLADKDALVGCSDRDLGTFAMGFNHHMFDVETQVRHENSICHAILSPAILCAASLRTSFTSSPALRNALTCSVGVDPCVGSCTNQAQVVGQEQCSNLRCQRAGIE